MVVGLLAVTALVVAGCSNSKEEGGSTVAKAGDGSASANDAPGVSDDEIRFAAFGTQANNPLGTCVLDCYTDGINAYFAFRNSEGGVHGRDLVLSTVLDDELTKNQQRALEVLSADDTFAAFSATQVPSGWAAMAEAGVPLYTWSIHPAEATGKDSIFGYSGVLCVKCTTRAPIYAGTLVDATTVGTLGYSVSASSSDCAAGAADSVERYGPDSGQVLGYTNDDLAFGLPNGIGPEVTAMKKAGVDFVIGCLDLNGMKTLAQELERQGMEEVVMFHPNTYDESFVGEAGDLFEGDIVNVSFRPFEADPGDSLLADFQHWMKKSDREITELAMIGWINADLAYQGLVDAGEGFDRARVIAATNELTGYTAGGLIPPVDWSRQHEPPAEDDALTHGPAQQCTAFVQVEDGEFELVGDQAKPFRCWDPSDRDWAEPRPRSGSNGSGPPTKVRKAPAPVRRARRRLGSAVVRPSGGPSASAVRGGRWRWPRGA
jgi:ABC-type branched-subunit amino acid transport system substrate-binding protein